ncbi:MAG: acetate kinase [Lachnospiraceae bacterium]|nr:acetate kinase [Lachnospiraceae bacterium]
MKVLVINCGSSSLKYRLIETDNKSVICKGLCERIGIGGGHFKYEITGSDKGYEKDIEFPDHNVAVDALIKAITDPDTGVVADVSEIGAVGHRIVHGGDKFTEATLITPDVMDIIEECSDLAPLHNPANIQGIRSCLKVMPDTAMVGVFDTAFHQTLPEKAYLYGIPYECYEKYGIRKYGFHGMSHEYVSKETAAIMGKDIKDVKSIICHLGNGASITAVDGGKSVDTSMGYTPLDGIIMGTRCGSLDPEIVHALVEKTGKSLDDVMHILNFESGVYGLSGYMSSDMRDIRDAYREGNEAAIRAYDTYIYVIVKYIGSYMAVLGGADAITFTAGIGENSSSLRKHVCDRLKGLGVEIDDEANENGKGARLISREDSKVKVYTIPTDEEMSIALSTVEVLKKQGKA